MIPAAYLEPNTQDIDKQGVKLCIYTHHHIIGMLFYLFTEIDKKFNATLPASASSTILAPVAPDSQSSSKIRNVTTAWDHRNLLLYTVESATSDTHS